MTIRSRVRDDLARIAHQVPHSVVLRAFHAWWQLDRGLWFEYFRQRAGLELLEDLRGYRTSDTVFILGSGGSLNEISDARWQRIAAHDSFGFNFSLVHPHRPTLYAFEYMGPSQIQYARFVEHAVEREDYRDLPKLFAHIHPQALEKFLAGVPEHFRENLFATFPVYTFARDRDELDSAIELLRQRGLWGTDRWDRQFKYRGTLSMMISVAVKMGYEKVVLCGVDLNNWAYFFDDAERYPSMRGYYQERRKNRVHGTFDRRDNVMPMDEIVYAMDELILRPRGIELFVENASSALHPRVREAPDHLFA